MQNKTIKIVVGVCYKHHKAITLECHILKEGILYIKDGECNEYTGCDYCRQERSHEKLYER